jgi:hypothetical protein
MHNLRGTVCCFRNFLQAAFTKIENEIFFNRNIVQRSKLGMHILLALGSYICMASYFRK